MELIDIGSQNYTTITVLDEQGPGGAHHEYEIRTNTGRVEVGRITFQNGPVKENQSNAVQSL